MFWHTKKDFCVFKGMGEATDHRFKTRISQLLEVLLQLSQLFSRIAAVLLSVDRGNAQHLPKHRAMKS